MSLFSTKSIAVLQAEASAVGEDTLKRALTGTNLFGAAVPTSILQLWVPRMELHLLYNAIVFIPMVIAMYYHLYPPAGEALPVCGCARACKINFKPPQPQVA